MSKTRCTPQEQYFTTTYGEELDSMRDMCKDETDRLAAARYYGNHQNLINKEHTDCLWSWHYATSAVAALDARIRKHQNPWGLPEIDKSQDSREILHAALVSIETDAKRSMRHEVRRQFKDYWWILCLGLLFMW
ncbi:hypothetical protein KEM54_002481 [Ascosphaera aggregata]|nr:hypothetical protein KEM54_002481 [Ascosphaera aggregata]